LLFIYIPVVPIRLVNGSSSHTGRVEVYTNTNGANNSEWGTICDDFWNIQDARVVCRQLGYPDAVAAPISAHFGPGTGPIWIDDVECVGTELNILMCPHNGIGIHNCLHSKDASAECLGKYFASSY